MAPWQLMLFTPLLVFGATIAGLFFVLLGRTSFKNRRLLRLGCDIASPLAFLVSLYVIGKLLEAVTQSPLGVPADNIWMINAALYLELFLIVLALYFISKKRLPIARLIRRVFGKPAKSVA